MSSSIALIPDSEHKHNFHTHTFRCKHAKGDVADYCEAALALGMETLGFSDHSALPDDRWLSARMEYAGLDDYVRAMDRARVDYPSLNTLRIELGLREMDIDGLRARGTQNQVA